MWVVKISEAGEPFSGLGLELRSRCNTNRYQIIGAWRKSEVGLGKMTFSKKEASRGRPACCVILICDTKLFRFRFFFFLLRFVRGVEGVLQRHEVFAGLQGIQRGLLGFQLLL